MRIRNIDGLPKAYHRLQASRIEVMRRRINGRPNSLFKGRVIPDPVDLPIGQGRRLDATILFLDISNFTERPSNSELEQDEIVRVLSLFFSEVIRIIEDYGGTVEKNTGDGVMAYFANQSLKGDSRKRAIACSLTIFHTVKYLINPIIVQAQLKPISFRICADHGPITIARMGAAKRFNHIVAVGAAANRTSKMLSYARPGEFLLGSAMLPGVPSSWATFLSVAAENTGWFNSDGTPYKFWLYDGRWNGLI